MPVSQIPIMQLLLLIVFVVVGGWVVWKVFTKLIHLVIFIAAICILVYIFHHVPAVHQMITSL